MKELEKIGRVIKKRIPDAPHECLLTIDATTGQNGLIQARMFKEAVDISGVVITKMDGTAKGGIALAVSHELDLPIKLIGTGEKMESLQPFDAADFSRPCSTNRCLAAEVSTGSRMLLRARRVMGVEAGLTPLRATSKLPPSRPKVRLLRAVPARGAQIRLGDRCSTLFQISCRRPSTA